MQKFYDNSTKSHKNRKRNMADKVLIVDDDISICKLLEKVMHSNELDTEVAGSGKEALELLKHHTYDVILMDIMLGDMEGFDVIKELRANGIQTPVMIVSGRNEDYDSLYGLSIGADDYITKPFNILEVKARIKAIMRRTGNAKPKEEENPKIVEGGDLKLDCESRRLFILGKEVNVTAKEFDLLELLVMNPNKVYSRENLLNLVWGYEYPGDVRTVDVHVRRLREKIEANPSEPKYVHTKWGVGYYYQS